GTGIDVDGTPQGEEERGRLSGLGLDAVRPRDRAVGRARDLRQGPGRRTHRAARGGRAREHDGAGARGAAACRGRGPGAGGGAAELALRLLRHVAELRGDHPRAGEGGEQRQDVARGGHPGPVRAAGRLVHRVRGRRPAARAARDAGHRVADREGRDRQQDLPPGPRRADQRPAAAQRAAHPPARSRHGRAPDSARRRMIAGRLRRVGALLAFIVLAGCAVAPDKPRERAPEPAPPAAPVPEPSPAPAPPPTPPVYLTVAAVGDMMLGTDYPENHLPDDDGVSFLAEVAPVLAGADVTFGNLEGVLLDGGTPAKECRNPRACYLFRSPSRYVEHFVNAGFDVLSLANNHARDFGEEGRTATMETLDAAGILHSGREGDFATLEVKGLSVAVLAFAVTRNSNMMLDYDLAAA